MFKVGNRVIITKGRKMVGQKKIIKAIHNYKPPFHDYGPNSGLTMSIEYLYFTDGTKCQSKNCQIYNQYVDSTGHNIEVGMRLRDKEGTYTVILHNDKLSIMSDKSIWPLTEFSFELNLDTNTITMKNFEIVQQCCLCGKDIVGAGNSPYPICEEDDFTSRCCDECNQIVILARMKYANSRKSSREIKYEYLEKYKERFKNARV